MKIQHETNTNSQLKQKLKSSMYQSNCRKNKKQNISHSAAARSRGDGLEPKNIINAALMMLQYCTTNQFCCTTAAMGRKHSK
jgi:hypothetical protein